MAEKEVTKKEVKTCPYCDEPGRAVPVCGACGVTTFICPSCHKAVERTKKTCPSCGAKIVASK